MHYHAQASSHRKKMHMYKNNVWQQPFKTSIATLALQAEPKQITNMFMPGVVLSEG